jgi:hypothetical protein
MSARVITLLRFSLLLAPLALLPAVSCKSDDEGGGNNLANTLLACGLLSAGELPSSASSTDPFTTCVLQCIAGSTCADLEAWLCSFDDTVEAGCTTQCLATYGHSCDGQVFPPYWVCDGAMDCTDGSDEAGCPPPFDCGDGTQIPPVWKCDGESDCANGSDEVGCPAQQTFMCSDGGQVPASYRCDFEPDCADGSDEVGCAMVLCPNSDTSGSMTTGGTSETGSLETGTG